MPIENSLPLQYDCGSDAIHIRVTRPQNASGSTPFVYLTGPNYNFSRPFSYDTTFDFYDLPNGTYTFRISGVEELRATFTVNCPVYYEMYLPALPTHANTTAGTLGSVEVRVRTTSGRRTSHSITGYIDSGTPVNFNQAAVESEATYTFSGLTPGSHTVTVDVSNGQRFSQTITIVDDGPAPTARCLAFDTPALTLPIAPPTLGQQNASITIHTVDGVGPIEATIDSEPPQTKRFAASEKGTTFTGLGSGQYQISVRDLGTYPAGLNCPPLAPKLVEVPVPPLQIGDQLCFLPWVKYKLAQAATLGAGLLRPSLRLSVTTAINGTEETPTETTAELYGPGDVLGLSHRAILGTTPDPDDAQFSPFQLASIEFKEEDLPWRYSAPLATDGPDAKPKPWCFLLVLEENEYTVLPQTGAPLPGIDVLATAPFPAAAQQHLWAHVQVNQQLGTDGAQPTQQQIEAFLNHDLVRNPDLAYSRLFCPRHLKPSTSYQAFLLPATEAGRLAGLGRPLSANSAGEPAWQSATTEDRVAFPVYYSWKFTTSESADFESLVRELHPATLAGSGPADLALTLPATGMAAARTLTLPLPGVVVGEGAAVEQPSVAVTQFLYEELKPGFTLTRPTQPGRRPVVTPPLYGRAYMVRPELLAPGTTLPAGWKHEVNLDPRYRAVASLGAQLVQENQEEFMQRAWAQVDDILVANQKLRGAQYGLRTTAGLRSQHLPVTDAPAAGPTAGARQLTATDTSAPELTETSFRAAAGAGSETESFLAPAPVAPAAGLANYGLQLTGLALSRVRLAGSPLTVRETIRQSAMPLAAFSPAFRRITKPHGRFLAGQGGPPRRPTQAPLALDEAATPADQLGAGTTLAQRDELLTLLQRDQLTPAPPRPHNIRAYQFDDHRVDELLSTGGVNLTPRLLQPDGTYQSADSLTTDFTAAFNQFRTLAITELGRDVVQFETPSYLLPALDLEQVKAGVVAGTKPDKVFLARVKQALGGFTPPVAASDFMPADFTGNDFLTGVAETAVVLEPSPLEPFPQEPTPETPPIIPAPEYSEFLVQPTTEEATFQSTAESESRLMAASFSAPASRTGGSAARPDAVTAELPAIRQVMAYPVFKDALGELLRKRHPELFLPGVADFPAGGIAVLGINHRFIEAFMLGANHALGSELLWRGFPTDMRGSYFQQFWDVSEQLNLELDESLTPEQQQAQRRELETAYLDVAPLDQWGTSALGSNSPTKDKAKLLLAIRSDLIRRYPNLVLCAQPALAGGQPDPAGTILYPQHQLPVGQDIITLSFDLDLEAATGANGGPGYFLVFMERPGQPQFGLDENAPVLNADNSVPKPGTWNDLSWQYMGTTPGGNLAIDPAAKPHATLDPMAHVTDSAELAYALFQQPVRAAIHASTLLLEA